MDTATNLSDASDTDLMLMYRDGNLDSFNELYKRHRTPLYRYIRNSCATEALTSDLFQDVWSRVINGRQGYSSSSPFQSWLYRIARNRLIDFYRSNQVNPVAFAEALDSESQVHQLQNPLQPDELSELSARRDALSAALNTLPVEQREAVLLRHIAGFNLQEIAELVDENSETVKSRLRYAFTKLRKQLRALS